MLPASYTWSLAVIAVAVAFAMLWAFKHCSDQARIHLTKRKIRAYLLAFRLFADEPSMIFRAQGQLLIWNLRYLALMVRPTAVTIIPLAFLLFQLDAMYGRRPLYANESVIVTAQLREASVPRLASLSLSGNGIAVETPALRLTEEHRVCWRVRVAESESGSVQLSLPGVSIVKSVQAGSRTGYLSVRRVSSLLAWLLYPRESRMPDAAVTSVEVDYPPAEIRVFGIGVHWLVWFSAVSLVAMLLLRRPMGVAF